MFIYIGDRRPIKAIPGCGAGCGAMGVQTPISVVHISPSALSLLEKNYGSWSLIYILSELSIYRRDNFSRLDLKKLKADISNSYPKTGIFK